MTAQAELAGHCSRVFSDENERQRYNNTLDRQRLAALEPLIETAGATGMISAVAMEQLLRKAREAGLTTDETRQYVADFAVQRKWSVEVPQASKVEKLQRCGGCGALNEENAKSCGHCGAPLYVECPRCKTVNPSENRACKNCGFSVGDHWTVRRLLREAELAAVRGSTQQALQFLKQAQIYWPDSQEVESRLAEVLKCQEEEQRLAGALKAAIADLRLREAEQLLRELQQRGIMIDDAEALDKRILDGLNAAKKLVDQAKALERAGRSNEAVRAYLDALDECRDYCEAVEGLANHPPEPPRDAKAVAIGLVVAVSWQESPSIGHPTTKTASCRWKRQSMLRVKTFH